MKESKPRKADSKDKPRRRTPKSITTKDTRSNKLHCWSIHRWWKNKLGQKETPPSYSGGENYTTITSVDTKAGNLIL